MTAGSEHAAGAEREIHVQGHGEVEATPDLAVITLGVVAREREARAAMRIVSERIHAIVAAVRDGDVREEDIQTTQLNLFLDQQANLYMASHNVTIRIQDVGKAGAILDAAVDAGANASAGIQFALSDRSEADDRALELAIQDARRKADTLARAVGGTIDRAERVTANGGGVMHDGPAFARRMPMASAAPAAIEAGQLRVVADVNVTYRFR